MVVGELFVNLGIKGSDKTVSALVGVEHQLKGLASVSLEAKAAIVGAMYALEQLFSKSGQQGTDLTNFNALVGVSAKTLQQYQYAARQMGVSNDETANSFKALQAAMTKTSLGQGAPKGFGQVAMLTGGITAQDVNKFMENPELLLQKLQEYAQKEKRAGVRSEVLKSFGLGDNMIAAITRGGLTQDVMKRAPTYSDNEIGALDKANIAWSNLGNKIQMAIGHLNAAHGGQIVKDFGIIVDLGLKAADVILKLVDRFKLFENIGRLFEIGQKGANGLFKQLEDIGSQLASFASKTNFLERFADHFKNIKDGAKALGAYFEMIASKIAKIAESSNLFDHLTKIFFEAIDIVGKFAKAFVLAETAIAGVGERFHAFELIGQSLGAVLSLVESSLKGISNVLDIINGGKEGEKAKNSIMDAFAGSQAGASILKLVPKEPSQDWTPKAPGVPQSDTAAKAGPTSVIINQDLNFSHEGKNASQTGDSVKRAVNDAFRQLNSQTQGS